MRTITINILDDRVNNSSKCFYSTDFECEIYQCSWKQTNKFFDKYEINIETPTVYVFVKNPKRNLIEQNDKDFKVYIGQTSNFKKRLIEHKKKYDENYFDSVLIIVSKSQNYQLNKDDLLYMEKELIRKFLISPNFNVINGNNGNTSLKLKAIRKEFLNKELDTIQQAFNFLGLNLTDEIINSSKYEEVNQKHSTPSTEFKNIYINVPKQKKIIKAILQKDNKITILKDQQFYQTGRPGRTTEEKYNFIKTQLESARLNDSIEVFGDEKKYTIKFKNNVTYKTPSAAGYLIHGGLVGGKIWIDFKTKKPLGNRDFFHGS